MKTLGDPTLDDDWDPHTYPSFVSGFHRYEDLQSAVVDATRGREVATVLELGIGTGETAKRLLSVHQDASILGIDGSQSMLDAAAASLPIERTTLIRGRIEDPLPPGPFDVVVSVLSVHHLDSKRKVSLFRRINEVLAPEGRFVLGDIVLDPNIVIPRESVGERLQLSLRERGFIGTAQAIRLRLWRLVAPGHGESSGNLHRDHPDLLVDQIEWLTKAGLHANVIWEKDQCAVVIADRHS